MVRRNIRMENKMTSVVIGYGDKEKKLYSSLWASFEQLRGGRDVSQHKDYILTLLFVKYVTDKFEGIKYADIMVPDGGSFNDFVA